MLMFTPTAVEEIDFRNASPQDLATLDVCRERAETSDLRVWFDIDAETGEIVARCESQRSNVAPYTIHLEHNRLICNCPSMYYGRFTCTHAQAVWWKLHRWKKAGTRFLARAIA